MQAPPPRAWKADGMRLGAGIQSYIHWKQWGQELNWHSGWVQVSPYWARPRGSGKEFLKGWDQKPLLFSSRKHPQNLLGQVVLELKRTQPILVFPSTLCTFADVHAKTASSAAVVHNAKVLMCPFLFCPECNFPPRSCAVMWGRRWSSWFVLTESHHILGKWHRYGWLLLIYSEQYAHLYVPPTHTPLGTRRTIAGP